MKCATCEDTYIQEQNLDGYIVASVCKCYYCSTCNNTGFYYVQNEDNIICAYQCDCSKFKRQARIITDAHLPGRYTGKRSGIKREQWLAADIRKPYIFGPPGSGKTHKAVAFARMFASELWSVGFISCSELKGFDLSDQQNDLIHKRVVIIDDLGSSIASNVSKGLQADVVAFCYNAQKPTIITSNLNLDELQAHLDARTASRIMEMCVPLKMADHNWRV